MQAKFERLHQQISQLQEPLRFNYRQESKDQFATYAAVCGLLDFRKSGNKSELQCQEESDAIAFFVALIQRLYSPNGYSLQLPPKFREFIDGLKSAPRTITTYNEMVYWGLVVLSAYQKGIEANQPLIVTPHAQNILKQAASPQIFVNPAAYQKMLLDEKKRRYSEYVELRQKSREQTVPLLQKYARTFQLHRDVGTIISLIPGVSLLIDGLPGTWNEIKKGNYASAIAVFIFSAVLSALSPLAALVNYFHYDTALDNIDKAIAETHASKDYVVTRVLTELEYKSLKEFRKNFKSQHQDVLAGNPTNRFNKPKKHVEKFTEGQEEKVRLYLDKQQAERLDAYQDFRNGRRVDANTFFKGLKASQQESIATAEMLNIDHERRHPTHQ